jgi:hypothetical protein
MSGRELNPSHEPSRGRLFSSFRTSCLRLHLYIWHSIERVLVHEILAGDNCTTYSRITLSQGCFQLSIEGPGGDMDRLTRQPLLASARYLSLNCQQHIS